MRERLCDASSACPPARCAARFSATAVDAAAAAPGRPACSGLLLSPGGEFAFVLFGEAVSRGIMGAALAKELYLVVALRWGWRGAGWARAGWGGMAAPWQRQRQRPGFVITSLCGLQACVGSL